MNERDRGLRDGGRNERGNGCGGRNKEERKDKERERVREREGVALRSLIVISARAFTDMHILMLISQ